MDSSSLIFWLVVLTLAAALAFGFWQLRRTQQSEARHGDRPGALERKLDHQQVDAQAGVRVPLIDPEAAARR